MTKDSVCYEVYPKCPCTYSVYTLGPKGYFGVQAYYHAGTWTLWVRVMVQGLHAGAYSTVVQQTLLLLAIGPYPSVIST